MELKEVIGQDKTQTPVLLPVSRLVLILPACT
jgi:hypothetical protein